MVKQASKQTSAAQYAFDDDREREVFVCSHVAAQAPILYVSHDADSDWQFLCGAPHEDAEGARLISLGQVVEADPTLNQLAKLGSGQQATREQVGADWSVSDPSEEFIERCVAQLGWCVQGVASEGGEPGFAYTIGLQHSYGLPELIVFGLPLDAAQRLLNLVAERARDGVRFETEVSYADLVADHDVRFRAVLDPGSLQQHMGYALWFYQGAPFRLLQVVWPDANGNFVDSPSAPEWLRKAQPLLR